MNVSHRKRLMKRNMEAYALLLPNLDFIYIMFCLSNDLDVKVRILPVRWNWNRSTKMGRSGKYHESVP